MALITWKPEYSVNVAEIDGQHRLLIDLINRLYDAMRSGQGAAALGPVLTELVEYTDYHFTAEENLLRRSGYPGLDEHRQVHAQLRERTRELLDRFNAGHSAITMDAMLFLSNWLNVHILEVDRKYAPFLQAAGEQ
jgi:hemerythrin-like metal-binding protein